MKRIKSNPPQSKMDMMPMIDVVFNLLVFFVMTFKIIAPEGDFNVRMPPKGPPPDTIVDQPPEPIRVRLSASPGGGLSLISFGDKPLGTNALALRKAVLQFVTQRGGPDKADVEVELNPDPNLRWEFVIEAYTAVTGQIKGGQVQKICDKVKFAPRRGG
jgi:biopolymer transport protein ExbD